MSLRDGFHGAGGVMVPVCRFALPNAKGQR
jgi:hypothetical protein